MPVNIRTQFSFILQIYLCIFSKLKLGLGAGNCAVRSCYIYQFLCVTDNSVIPVITEL